MSSWVPLSAMLLGQLLLFLKFKEEEKAEEKEEAAEIDTSGWDWWRRPPTSSRRSIGEIIMEFWRGSGGAVL